MIRLIIALGVLALAPQAQAQPALRDAQRPTLLRPEKPMSCAEIAAALARLLPAATDERNRLQALYRSNGCLDQAFTRRLNTITEFPVPDTASRTAIWGQSLPVETKPPPAPPAHAEGVKTPATLP